MRGKCCFGLRAVGDKRWGCQGAVASGVFLDEVSLALMGVGSLALLSLYKYEFWKRKPRLYEEWNFYCPFAGALAIGRKRIAVRAEGICWNSSLDRACRHLPVVVRTRSVYF
jgi:hypothetical protein